MQEAIVLYPDDIISILAERFQVPRECIILAPEDMAPVKYLVIAKVD